ncbi:phosphotransferase family protein [Streptomyces sp. NPDC057474]|uniref:phosphotransferase family protein n=1 Tax=Streptomyces sp. NPDC057474 TaxID=3346144 RepID=UPI0036BC442E
MSHHPPHRAHQALVRPFAELRRLSLKSEEVAGHHNDNRIGPLGQPLAFLLGVESGHVLAKFRKPFDAIEVVPRIWRRESKVLSAVRSRLSEVPDCLVDFGKWSVHAYVPGQALCDVARQGRIGVDRLGALADFFACLPDVPLSALPKLPTNWPENGDSLGFLRWLARFTEERVHQVNRLRFGNLFEAVGIPYDAMQRFLSSVPSLTERPFSLLHTDVHRANVVVSWVPGGERLFVIDWELAMYGDPLHDLATHLVRMEYEKAEHDLMVRLWADAMCRAGHSEATAEMDRDLPHYLDFEYAQSVYPDVMRAAVDLPDRPTEREFARATDRVCRAMSRAREPLDLMDRPPLDRITAGEALRWWHKRDRAAMVGGAATVRATETPDAAGQVETLERHG